MSIFKNLPPEAEGAAQTVEAHIIAAANEINLLWRYGDGEGALVIEMIIEVMRKQGYAANNRAFDSAQGINSEAQKKKKRISPSLRKIILERDFYRCRHCSSHLDLTVDHVIPESRGGDLSHSNLQTLCRSCNSKKGVKPEGEMA